MSNFKTLLIQDSRIANITDQETFAVTDGPSQSNYQNFSATTQSGDYKKGFGTGSTGYELALVSSFKINSKSLLN